MCWEQVRAALVGVDVGLDRAALVEGFAVRDLLDVTLLRAVAEYEAAGLHDVDGHLTMAAWLRVEAGRDHIAAQRCAVNGRKLRAFPVLAAAVLDGRITGGQLDVILAHVPKRHVDLFAEHERWFVDDLAGLSVEQTVVAMGQWRRLADGIDPGPAPSERPNQLALARTIDNRGELRGSFDSDLTALVEAALRVADPKDFQLPAAERRAVALGQVCQTFLDHQRTQTGGRHRPHLNVVIRWEDIREELTASYLDTGQPVSPAALGALMCDGAWHRLVHDGSSTILDYSRATRDWPVNLYNAIAVRDGGCRWPGCEAPTSWCDVHHAVAWEAGGSTSIDNGLMLCRRHHHRTHTPAHHLKLLPDATVEVTLPSGRVLASLPRGPGAARPPGRPEHRAA